VPFALGLIGAAVIVLVAVPAFWLARDLLEHLRERRQDRQFGRAR
jgi:hypothetical protein